MTRGLDVQWGGGALYPETVTAYMYERNYKTKSTSLSYVRTCEIEHFDRVIRRLIVPFIILFSTRTHIIAFIGFPRRYSQKQL